MIKKDKKYYEFVSSFIKKVNTQKKYNSVSCFLLFIHSVTSIKVYRKKLGGDTSNLSFNLIPLVNNELIEIGINVFLEEDLAEVTKELGFKSKTFIYLFIGNKKDKKT